ncbi:MAG: ATP-binding protein [Deltaproteobacteria bacterium]|nr:ATP-binding protein [Deltaproteobacteria bacterium]
MLRSQEQYLTEWMAKSPRKPLVIRGARQVGKSTLVRRFAERSGLTLHEVNLERQPHLRAAFESMDVHRILTEVEFIARKGPITGCNGLLFLDEIQAIPAALSALRYFYEDAPALPVVAAGSLLEFALADTRYSMPVGRIRYLFMGPMSFEETLRAHGDIDLLSWLSAWTPDQDVPLTAHQRLVERLRSYLVVGGMPEVVSLSIASGLGGCQEAQDGILETYRDDFPKYRGTGSADTLLRAYEYLQRHVGEKVKYANIDRDAQSRSVRRAVELLFKAHIAFPVQRTSATGLSLAAGLDARVYKSYFLDCGLVARASGITWIDDATLWSTAFLNRGPLAEQFVAQHLWASQAHGRRPELWYWLREGRSNNAELDFVMEHAGKNIVPIEVKAGKSGTMKSLFHFAASKHTELALRFDLNLPSLVQARHVISEGDVNLRLLSLPLYMVEQARRLLGVSQP